MKKIILSLLFPLQVFCCSTCVDVLEAQKEIVLEQIQQIDESYVHAEETLMYLFGHYAGLQEAIFLLQITGNCP